MPKAILFDADGVLIASEFLSTRLVKHFGAPHEVFDEFFGGPFQECLVGKADLKIEMAKHMHRWKWDKDLDALLEYWFHADSNRVDQRFDSVIADFKKQGIVCALGTNNEKYRTHDLVHNKGLGKWVDKIFSSGHLGIKKPDQKFFAHVAKELKLRPSEIDFWDDDSENVEAAKVYGMNAHLYTSYEDFLKYYGK